MPSSPAVSEGTPSTKAALDHLQHLIEQLLRENHHLRLSLQQTRSQLDEVRTHLNRIKLQVAEHEKSDHVVRRQIRCMTTLIERRRDAHSPPSSPEVPPAPPPSSPSKSPLPTLPPGTILPSDAANTSNPASKSPTTATRDTPLSNINGNHSEIAAVNDSDTVSSANSHRICTENERGAQPEPYHHSKVGNTQTSSSSSSSRSVGEKLSSPSTSVSDALQKAFVAMEKDTTNAVQVLHNTKRAVSLQTVGSNKQQSEQASNLSVVNNTATDNSSHDASELHEDHPSNRLKKKVTSSRKRSAKTLKKESAGSLPGCGAGSSTSAKRSVAKGRNGRLAHSVTTSQSPRSRSKSANNLAKSVSLKKTKKGYKVNMGLSRKSSKSGDSSSSSSDSDSSGPGFGASVSGPFNRPAKAQVSLEAGFPELISAARKLKDNLKHRKEDDGKLSGNDQEHSESGEKDSDGNSENLDQRMNPCSGIEQGPFVNAKARSDSLATASNPGEGGHGSFPYATGSPLTMNQELTDNRTTRPEREQSISLSCGDTNRLKNVRYPTDVPHNPVPESTERLTPRGSDHFNVERINGMQSSTHGSHALAVASVAQGYFQDSDDQSLAAGKATAKDIIEDSADVEIGTLHEITHVPMRPHVAVEDDNLTSSSSVKLSPGGVTEFLTTRSGTGGSRSSELLAWKARAGSKYVDASNGALAVKYSAAVSLEDGKVVMNGKMRVLKPVGRNSNNTGHCYVSSMYPDGTFLPYIPVSGVVLHGKPVHWDSSQYGDQKVQLSFPKEVFDTIVSHTRRAYRKRYPGAKIHFPGAFLAGNRVRKVVGIEPECSVNMTRLQSEPSQCSVAETLAAIKKDVVGLALFFLSIQVRTDDNSSAEVIFGLHSMVAHRLSVDRRR